MPKRIHKQRAVTVRRREEVHEDVRTQRERQRGQAERQQIARELEELEQDIDDVLREVFE